VALVYNPRAARSNNRHAQSGWVVTNGIRADHHSFTNVYRSIEKNTIAYGSGVYGSVEKNMVAYESGMWVYMQDVGGPLRGTWYGMYIAN
jgi:hypothetical protein